MPMSRSESIIVNQMLLRKIVYAVNKAITQDVPQDMRDNLQIATFCGQQGRISRTVRAILSGQFEGTAGLGYPGPANQY